VYVFLAERVKLKIPWKNLYGEPTVAQLDGLYLVAVPTISEFQISFKQFHNFKVSTSCTVFSNQMVARLLTVLDSLGSHLVRI